MDKTQVKEEIYGQPAAETIARTRDGSRSADAHCAALAELGEALVRPGKKMYPSTPAISHVAEERKTGGTRSPSAPSARPKDA
jgi:hypothetical protein